jgi:PhzF family phenazine biosynthesis protein
MATREIAVFQVDAFTEHPFRGNPAAVCPLTRWLPEAEMRSIAAEMNLSETAFFVPHGDEYQLRWFTPAVEVPLCGHATLACARVLFGELEPARKRVVFHSKSGPLIVTRSGDRYVLDFPGKPPTPVGEVPGLSAALGTEPIEVLQADRSIAVLDSAQAVRALRPDLRALAQLSCPAVCVTARGDGADADVDFVSRYFAPAHGVPEDPVTGSAHCVLTPYWAERLGRTRLRARQVSARGGEIDCELAGDRVLMTGSAVLIMRGTLYL